MQKFVLPSILALSLIGLASCETEAPKKPAEPKAPAMKEAPAPAPQQAPSGMMKPQGAMDSMAKPPQEAPKK